LPFSSVFERTQRLAPGQVVSEILPVQIVLALLYQTTDFEPRLAQVLITRVLSIVGMLVGERVGMVVGVNVGEGVGYFVGTKEPCLSMSGAVPLKLELSQSCSASGDGARVGLA